MRYRSDEQSFEDTLDDAVREMHRQIPRGNQPSSRVWKMLAEQAGIEEVRNDDSHSALSVAQKRTSPSGKPEPRINTASKSHLKWSTWLAAALVVLLIGASVNFLMPEDNGGGNDSEHSIALAPGTPDMAMIPQLQVATPIASPGAHIPEYGPEYACHAEPLTEEQVLDIVMNPSREYVRRGSETQGPNLDKPREDYHWLSNQVHSIYINDLFVPVEDPELAELLVDTSNDFWNCLMTGTAFQVWSLIDPANVQREVLSHYPVVRDETVLRTHIEEWGPRRYMSGLHISFPNLEYIEPIEATMTADSSYGSIRLMPSPFESVEHTRAKIVMNPHPDATRWVGLPVELEFVRAADGTWWATRVIFDTP